MVYCTKSWHEPLKNDRECVYILKSANDLSIHYKGNFYNKNALVKK